MRRRRRGSHDFARGVAVGLASAGVAFLAAVLARRTRGLRARLPTATSVEELHVIDREPGAAEFDVWPRPEASTSHEPLASEARDVVGDSERW